MAKSRVTGQVELGIVPNGTDRWERLRGTQSLHAVTWADADVEMLRRAVMAVVEDGGAIILGRTSDGGALMVQILHGQGRVKIYPASQDELDTALMEIEAIATGR